MDSHTRFIRPLVMLAATALVAGSACTANKNVPQPTPSGTPTAAIIGTVTIVQATPPPVELTPPPAPSGLKRLSANFATRDELRAAFANEGILNAAKWAELIEDARPFQPRDVNFVTLRATLREGGAPPADIEKIVALLVP